MKGFIQKNDHNDERCEENAGHLPIQQSTEESEKDGCTMNVSVPVSVSRHDCRSCFKFNNASLVLASLSYTVDNIAS